MSSIREVPEPWATRMVERGYTRRDGGANISELARKAGLAVETVRRVVHGIGTPGPETVAALVDKLGADVEDWTGQHVTAGPYVPPSESALLTGPQRDALTDLIRAIAAGQRQRAGDKNVEAPMSQAPVSGAAVEGVRMRARTPSGPLPGSPSQEPTRSPGRRARR